MMNSKTKHSGLRLFQNLAKNSTTSKKFDDDPSAKKPALITYQNNFGGVIKSYIDRIPFSSALYKEMIGEWNKTKAFVRVHSAAAPVNAQPNQVAGNTKPTLIKDESPQINKPNSEPKKKNTKPAAKPKKAPKKQKKVQEDKKKKKTKHLDYSVLEKVKLSHEQKHILKNQGINDTPHTHFHYKTH